MNPFVIGQTYQRRNINVQYGGQRYGGISTPAGVPYIFIFTGDQGSKYGYSDRFREDGLFWYTGEGQVGDMEMIRGNLAIRDHAANGKEIHLFEYTGKSLVKYVGRAIYKAHVPEILPDRNGDLRNAIVFKFLVETDSQGVPEIEPEHEPRPPAELWRMPMVKLREAALGQSNAPRTPVVREINAYYRSEAIRVYVLRRANGICEGCGSPAPFKTKDGRDFLETHHIRRRADAGPDHPRWVIALCPNCHRRVHYGADGHDYNVFLHARLDEIEPDPFEDASAKLIGYDRRKRI